MAKALLLTGWFMVGCIASSLIAWFGSLHSGTFRVAFCFYILIAGVWAICWLADDAIAPFFRAQAVNYYSCLIAFAVAALIGGIALWLSM